MTCLHNHWHGGFCRAIRGTQSVKDIVGLADEVLQILGALAWELNGQKMHLVQRSGARDVCLEVGRDDVEHSAPVS